MKAQLMRNVTVARQIKVELSREQWELYSDTPHIIVAELNMLVTDAINESDSYSQAILAVEHILSEYSQYGAADTEPHSIAVRIITKFFS